MTLTADLFEPHVGSEIIVHLDDGTPFVLTLTSLIPARPAQQPDEAGETARDRGFSMTLQGPHSPVLRDLTYPMSFGDAAPVHLFISPHYQDAKKTLYNIVVN